MTGGGDRASAGQHDPLGSMGAAEAPPLPPSPLARLVAGPAARGPALPWTTALAVVVLPLPVSVLTSSLPLSHYGPGNDYPPLVAECWRAALMVVGAAVMDRLAPSWPRWARWGIGMVVGGLAPTQYLLLCPGRCGRAVHEWASGIGLMALGSGAMGLLLGVGSGGDARPGTSRMGAAVLAGAGVEVLWALVVVGLSSVSGVPGGLAAVPALAASIANGALVDAVVGAANGAIFALVVVAGLRWGPRLP